MIDFLAALVFGVGLALLTVALLKRGRERQDEILRYLELPFSEEDIDPNEVVERVGLLTPSVTAFDEALSRTQIVDRLSHRLEKSRTPLKPGEFVLAAISAAVTFGLWVGLLTDQWIAGIITFLAIPFLAWFYLGVRVSRRQRAFEEQLPSVLGLIASSLRSGHTLQRSISMMVEESSPPVSEEFERVMAEIRLGLPLIDALDRMADRLDYRDFEWIVHAIRIQQQTGGKLADLLFTLAEYMRAREEVRREVRVLTAEGRLSAFVLGALPFVLALYLQFTNPDYIGELFTGTGWLLVIGGGLFMGIGLFIIMQMVKAVDL